MRALARADLLNYPSVDYTVAKIATIENVNNGTYFIATDTNGTKYTGRKVMLATGSRDILPNFPGMDVIWGTGAFWCLYCPPNTSVVSWLIVDGAMVGNIGMHPWESSVSTSQMTPSLALSCIITSQSTPTEPQSNKHEHERKI